MRRCAALIAAYALALQAIISAFAVPVSHALAAGAAFEICRADISGDPARPPARDSCGACLAGHCAGTAATPVRIAVAGPWPIVVVSAPTAFRAAALPPLAPHGGPHAPRAPPLC
jgi:hypothetical protein